MSYGNMFAHSAQPSGSMPPPSTMSGYGGFAMPGPALPFILNSLLAQQSSAPFTLPNGQIPRAGWQNPLQQQQSTPDSDDFSQSDEYDKVLVNGLVAARTYGISYLTAINCIPSTPGRSVFWWKQYYLEHMRRIDRSILRGGHAPTPVSNNPVKPTAGPSHTSAPPKLRMKRKAPSPTPVSELESAVSQSESEEEDDEEDDYEAGGTATRSSPPRTRRRTLSSKAQQHNDSTQAKKQPQKIWRKHVYYLDIPKRLPNAPPTPPPAVRLNRGFAFTDKDKAYFVNFLLWHAKTGSVLTKAVYCKKMSDEVPHHSEMSWGAFWNRVEPKGLAILEEGRRMAKKEARAA